MFRDLAALFLPRSFGRRMGEGGKLTARILHVISGLQIGGAENALLRLIASSGDGRYVHKVVSMTSGGSMLGRFVDAKVDVTVLDFKRSPLLSFFRLIRLISAFRPDIVQAWMYHADLVGGLAARIAGIRNVIWGIRTTDINVGGASLATAMARRLCAILSYWIPTRIVCAAEASRRSHVALGYCAERMVVVSNGFDITWLVATEDERAQFRKEHGIGSQEFVIGSLGRFNAAKDHHTFVRAAGLLVNKHPNVKFLLIGPGLSSDNVKLMKWIRETGMANRFILLGERSDVRVCFAAMDVMCLHSRTEGFPNVVGEAMALGVPCVVTDVGDAALLIGDAGVVVPKSDPAALASGLETMINMHKKDFDLLGVRAKQRIRSEFTTDHMRERFESVYRGLGVEGNR